MLWDKTGVEPVDLVTDKRGTAIALSSCERLIDQLRCALNHASFDLVGFDDVEACTKAIASQKPDIIFIDERLVANPAGLQDDLLQARVTETLPILSIKQDDEGEQSCRSCLSVHSSHLEIFLKTRAVLRRERSIALRGKRQSGPFILDEPRFKLIFGEKSADLSKPDLCLLGPFFDVKDAILDRQSLERLVFEGNVHDIGSRLVDFQLSRMRRRVKAQLDVDPLRSVRGIGYAIARV